VFRIEIDHPQMMLTQSVLWRKSYSLMRGRFQDAGICIRHSSSRMIRSTLTSLAGIAYAGVPGSSLDCKAAVLQLLSYGERIKAAKLLTYNGSHCFLLTVGDGDLVAVKSGFASGYVGEGPRALSLILQVLKAYGVDIEEYEVTQEQLARLDVSALTHEDVERLEQMDPVRPARWYDYARNDSDWKQDGTLFGDLEPRLPIAVIDSRIVDLAIYFEDDADGKLLKGYRRLEDSVRERTGLTKEFGTKLFSKAFAGEDSLLTWEGIDGSEHQGRALLFTGAYMAHRNPRAHQESKHGLSEQISELLLLNHLYALERKAILRLPPPANAKSC
jgi:uncharacterized protein Ymh